MPTLTIHTNRPGLFQQKKGGGSAYGKFLLKRKKKKGSAGKGIKKRKFPKGSKSTYKNQEDVTLFTNQAKVVNKDGKSYLVVPGVPVQEQVMNTYFLPSDEIRPEDWEGTPIALRHPQLNNGSVQVPEPDVPIIGYVTNVSMDPSKKRMLADYYFDEEVTTKYPEGQVILTTIKNGGMVETSTAYWADEDYTPGNFGGRDYKSIHRNLRRDHIAVFPGDQLGACSIQDGCGVNRNMAHNCGCSKHTQQNSEYPDYKANHLPTAMLIGYALNKGSRTKDQIEKAKAFIAKNGITKPVWVKCNNGKYKILDGNHRVSIAEELGIEQIPVRAINGILMELDPEAVYREWLHEQDQGYLE